MKISTDELLTMKKQLKRIFGKLNDKDITTYGNCLRVYSDSILKAIDWEIEQNEEEKTELMA